MGCADLYCDISKAAETSGGMISWASPCTPFSKPWGYFFWMGKEERKREEQGERERQRGRETERIVEYINY